MTPAPHVLNQSSSTIRSGGPIVWLDTRSPDRRLGCHGRRNCVLVLDICQHWHLLRALRAGTYAGVAVRGVGRDGERCPVRALDRAELCRDSRRLLRPASRRRAAHVWRACKLRPQRARSVVYVPYPPPAGDWTLRTMTSGVALQCSPSKDRIARYPLHELSPTGARRIDDRGGWSRPRVGRRLLARAATGTAPRVARSRDR